ncbi:T9SS type A sorting domain-containing protein [Winogradskyella flava]|uniref:T9SS type A sorting domain-containing protein n=1 Tax=Winogradskyella flava TaxID=1884876 RepID=A0A842IS63_9FLAO|nr:T9SS type A sorting domain-containing protein [Winogradskyella flava]MBC2843718.1 T9SS type A sorting domain-containing protein [Winogradskyella flava]
MKKDYLLKKISLKPILFNTLLLFFFLGLNGQEMTLGNTVIHTDWDVCTYYPLPDSHRSKVGVPEKIKQRMESGRGGCATFIVGYNGFTPEAQAAFQFAVDIWSNSIESPIPIRVSANFGPLDPGVLGGAGPTSFRTVLFSGFPSNTVFPIALAEKLTGAEIPDPPSSTSIDINATFSSTANFYFGTDGNTPLGQIDFVSVVLHELGHGLGILGFGSVDNENNPTVGILRNSGFVNVWDNFIENGTPAAITSFPDPSAALLSEFTGNNLFSNGPITTAQNGNVKPSTYAPVTFNSGSSYSHWDENTYPAGNPTSLMTPFIAPGEAIHDPGLVTLGFMEDMGWSICGGSLTVDEFNVDSVEVSPNPFTESVNIKLANGINDDYNINLFDINGRVVMSERFSATNGTITISNLDRLEDAFYFIKITNLNNNSSITKKIVKN